MMLWIYLVASCMCCATTLSWYIVSISDLCVSPGILPHAVLLALCDEAARNARKLSISSQINFLRNGTPRFPALTQLIQPLSTPYGYICSAGYSLALALLQGHSRLFGIWYIHPILLITLIVPGFLEKYSATSVQSRRLVHTTGSPAQKLSLLPFVKPTNQVTEPSPALELPACRAICLSLPLRFCLFSPPSQS